MQGKITKIDQKYIVLMKNGGLCFDTIGMIFGVSAQTAKRHYYMELRGEEPKLNGIIDWASINVGLCNIEHNEEEGVENDDNS